MTRGGGSLHDQRPANANVAPPGWYMVFLDRRQRRAVARPDRPGRRRPATRGADRARRRSTGRRAHRRRRPELGRRDRQRRRRRVPRLPLDDLRLHAVGARTASRRVKSGTTYTDRGLAARHLLLPGARGRQGRATSAPASPPGDARRSPATRPRRPSRSRPPPTGATPDAARSRSPPTASDTVGVTSVQFKLDGQDLGAADTASPYSLSWDTTTATDGPHTLTAVARDATGNTTTSAARHGRRSTTPASSPPTASRSRAGRPRSTRSPTATTARSPARRACTDRPLRAARCRSTASTTRSRVPDTRRARPAERRDDARGVGEAVRARQLALGRDEGAARAARLRAVRRHRQRAARPASVFTTSAIAEAPARRRARARHAGRTSR